MTLEELKQAVIDPKTDTYSKVVGEYVLQKSSDSADFAAKVQQKGHTLERCMKFVFYQAAQLNKEHCAMMAFGEDKVFKWADAYFELDAKKEKSEVAAAEKLMNDLQAFRRTATAKKEKADEAKAPEKKAKSAQDTAPAETPKVPDKEPEKVQDPEVKTGKEKKKTSMEGQFSLFDLM